MNKSTYKLFNDKFGERDILLIGDNLSGGAARLAERFIIGWIDDNRDNNLKLYVMHSKNIFVPEHLRVIQYTIKRSKFFIFDYIKRCFFLLKFKIDTVVINFSNFPLPDLFFLNKKKQIVILHNAYILCSPICYLKPNLFFQTSQIYKRIFFYITLIFCKKAYFIVQTQWMKEKVVKNASKFKIKNPVYVVPYFAHLESEPIQKFKEFNDIIPNLSALKPYWFYPAAFYPHKNHNFLVELAEKLKENSNIKIIITISSESKYQKDFFNLIKSKKLENILINVGWINQNLVYHYLFHSEGLIFPSTFESLGIPLLEALSFKKRIIAANIESSKEILGSYAVYFDIFSKNSSEIVCHEMLKKLSSINYNSLIKPCSIYFAYYKSFLTWIKDNHC